MFVGDKEIGRVPCLAICQDEASSQFMLYYCDADWMPIGIASYDTVDAAKKRAEPIYPRSLACWVEGHFRAEEVDQYRRELWAEHRCSFCGKTPEEAKTPFFQGVGGARICSDCIRQFDDELRGRKMD